MNVLVVDDEALICRSLTRAFEARGHDVMCANDGLEGYAIWQKSRFDIVLLDVLMPGLTGPQLLEKMPQSGARIILMSAYTGDYDVKKAKELGADLFLPKPFQNIFEIVERAEHLVKNKQP